MNKKLVIGLITSFEHLDKVINSYKLILNELSKEFGKIYIINNDNLKFFYKKKKYNFKLKKDLNSNLVLFDPSNTKEFVEFIKNKKLILINSFGRRFSEMKTHYILNKENITQIMISNIGNIQGDTASKDIRKIYKLIFKQLPHYLTILFYGFGLFKKISARFISNLYIYKNFRSPIFSQVEKMIPINSRAYDQLILNKKKKEKKYIVFLDHSINHPEWIDRRGLIDKKFEKKIYELTEIFLEKLSKLYKKKVIVCIHPTTNLNNIKNLLKKFKIVKFRTPENILKSYIVVFSDSSSIVDAFILKKKIICIKSLRTEIGKLSFLKNYHNQGLFEIDLDRSFKFDKKKIDKALASSIRNYTKYNKHFTQLDKDTLGVKKIINYIKKI